MNRNDIEKIWDQFILNVSPRPKQLTFKKPIVNFLGSVKEHKKVFLETFDKYNETNKKNN